MYIEYFSGKPQVRFPRCVFWDGIFTAISQTNTLFTFLYFHQTSFNSETQDPGLEYGEEELPGESVYIMLVLYTCTLWPGEEEELPDVLSLNSEAPELILSREPLGNSRLFHKTFSTPFFPQQKRSFNIRHGSSS